MIIPCAVTVLSSTLNVFQNKHYTWSFHHSVNKQLIWPFCSSCSARKFWKFISPQLIKPRIHSKQCRNINKLENEMPPNFNFSAMNNNISRSIENVWRFFFFLRRNLCTCAFCLLPKVLNFFSESANPGIPDGFSAIIFGCLRLRGSHGSLITLLLLDTQTTPRLGAETDIIVWPTLTLNEFAYFMCKT